MRGWRRLAVLVALTLLSLSGETVAAEWGTINPGQSTMEAVRAQYGGPTRTATQKVEGYDTAQWVYEGPQAPGGIRRLVVDFGLLTPAGFQPALVRSLTLEPKPGAFTQTTVLEGWGEPTKVSAAGQPKSFFYESGLVVLFDTEGWQVETMLFTPPQAPAKGQGTPRP
ncbi:MAG: hypothetical protein AUH29_00890 [Candidatus Rokubacteria bacterium 13_1_40CM_69_27]|nr:MAG: hypothetical protein AUH29_00890 [Candidatus Rokubacteria bacterium 13_1_40CM_69_27]OLC37705.1 MAG: hypothetical protein AUH81_05590 [Candidatus Rokubacteria bacterium 13_1_40CM_4_69_5]OLE39324.1 MAG: hypothetical protein AUG00_02640 [Candidatus Rokubacteria bacterium 13_1_20CM_2_70_7]